MSTPTAHTYAPHGREEALRSASMAAEARRAPEALHAHRHGEGCNEDCLRVEPDGTTAPLHPRPAPTFGGSPVTVTPTPMPDPAPRPQLRFPLDQLDPGLYSPDPKSQP